MLHFDTNALVALPHWAREGHPAVTRVLVKEPLAVSALVWHQFLAGPLAETETVWRVNSSKDVF